MEKIESNEMINAMMLDYYNEMDEDYSNLDICILEAMEGNETFEIDFTNK